MKTKKLSDLDQISVETLEGYLKTRKEAERLEQHKELYFILDQALEMIKCHPSCTPRESRTFGTYASQSCDACKLRSLRNRTQWHYK